MTTVHEYLNRAVQRLKNAGIDEAGLEAEVLLMHVLSLDRTRLFLDDKVLDINDVSALDQLLERRLRREPLAYIIGEKEFWSRSFLVTPDVLIPRPETERLIEIVLEHTTEKKSRLNILDLGVGSGVIAIILASELPESTVCGVDSSGKALDIAHENAKRHQVDQQVNFVCGNWFSAIYPQQTFDLIVSNPPYVSEKSRPDLQPELSFEPQTALYSGANGLDDIASLAPQISNYLKEGGWFFMEIGEDQTHNVLDLFSSLHDYAQLKVHKDYAGRPRIFQAQLRQHQKKFPAEA